MRRLLFLFVLFLSFTNESSAQCTLTGSPNVNSSTVTCSTFSSCTTIYIGDGINPTNVVMNQNLNLSCYGAIQFVVRNNANIDFSNGNYDLTLAAGSSIVVESGGNISAGSNCSASDLIKIGTVKVASCNGGGGALTDFPGLVNGGGYNVVTASATSVCGSGTSVITASQYPTPTSSTTFKFYTVASGGSPVATSTVTSSPYTATYTTTTLSSTATYYVEAVTNSSGATTPRKAVEITVNPLPAAPSTTLTQPTCTVATGTITVNSPAASGMTYSINGSTYTNTTGIFTAVASGAYNVTAKSAAGCVSSAVTVTINAQPATPVKPTLGSITQPTCTVATGTISVANYNASYTYTVSPSAGVSISGGTITAPAGTYTVTATLGSCSSVASNSFTITAQPTNTWNGTSWSAGSPPTLSQKIVFTGAYSSTGNISGCSCQVNSTASVTFNAGHTLTVANAVTVNSGGSLMFEDTASLVQNNDASVNSGNIIYKRKTTAVKAYDYTYWSSPVSNATLSQLAGDLFYSYSPIADTFIYQTLSDAMTPGVGYIARAPENLTYNPTLVLQTSFIGTPNNGNISTPIIKDTGFNNLIGNPYPSAIDIDLFLTDPANLGIVNGTIFLWTHNTAITNNNYTTNDYAKYNLTGSVKTASAAVSGGAVPTGKVAAGQGFFIEANSALSNGSYTALFNNSMRVSGNNNQFFRTTATASNNDGGSVSQALEKHRIWLSLSNSEGAYNEMLVGYIQNATNGFDSLFDGKTTPVGNAVAIYTTVGTTDLSIQGKALPFSETDVVPFGYSTTINGDLTISLEDFDGIFDTQAVYLLDKATGAYHDLKEANYTFTTQNGTFNGRFEIRYTNQALGTNAPIVSDNDIKVVSNNHGLSVYCASTAITKVEVFDTLGKILYHQQDLSTNATEPVSLQAASQMLLVKVTLANGETYTKKTLIQ